MPFDAVTEHSARLVLKLRNRHFFILDLLFLLVLPIVALELREDAILSNPSYNSSLVVYTLTSVPLWLGVFVICGLYSLYWKYASIAEMGTILKAVLTGTALNLVWYFLVLRPTGWVRDDFPRSFPLLVGLVVLLAIGGSRYSVRLLDRMRGQRKLTAGAHKRVLILGAGNAGTMIVREMQANPQLSLKPVAFLDDNPRKAHTFIHGVPVVGGRDAIATIIHEYGADEAIIAMPTAPGKTIRELTALCLKNNVTVKTVPGMFELLDGSVTVSKLRNVDIDDLLRREPVAAESTAIAEMLRGKRVLVTGAGGSIGGELCRQIAHGGPAQLILLGHGENSIFYQTNELTASHPHVPLVPVIADIRDAPRLNAIMARYQPELVFHAAAHKHVSLMETNLEEAVTNNVQGTRSVLEAAVAHNVETFVMISTDKAVNPVSIMGATKRIAELYVHARALETGKRLVAVRFGNVLGSRGSVVPLFKQQIASGGPIKVTHPEVRRFFMTIPEAVHLVLQSAAIGTGGEIFALEMGEPVRIVDLATDLIRLSGLQVGHDIDIEFTGLRPGEKLYEELFVPGETYERTLRDKIYVARNGVRPAPEAHRELYAQIDALVECARAGDSSGVRQKLGIILPEFQVNREGE